MRRFWCSLFILPKSVIYECEKTLRRFLWDSLRDTRKPGKVKWAVVCRPLEDGGLGIKDLTTLNKALILKQLWVLLIDHNSLWAKRRPNLLVQSSILEKRWLSCRHPWMQILAILQQGKMRRRFSKN
ncbi:hypothetical protein CFOL_v3_29858 [Cephalotus follicularis]|uniref:Zf-RVT domain-containing protein n=1 Tax=Cephalotus follicularis TaxID=3775 RepID=A0A1Q3D1S1_CEPFO|nr:hypothetical protein CFOL_v3_29858 [Cephalotus follicularis]